MGLKSGSRDAGLDDAEQEEQQNPVDGEGPNTGEEETEAQHPTDSSTTRQTDRQVEQEGGQTGEAAAQTKQDSARSETGRTQRPTLDSLPYKLRREKVNEGREQVPYFLREEVIEREDELQDALEELLGETVYKSDYREAAMVVAQRNPDLVAEILREWGYDLDMT